MKLGRNQGCKNPKWCGGRRKRPDGYIDVWAPAHPYQSYNRVLEHRLVVEQSVGRYLKPSEHVHHKNGNRSDNRLCNLQLLSHSEHARLHATGIRRTKPPPIGKDVLEDFYCKRGMLIKHIAAFFDVGKTTIRSWMIKHNIKLRTKNSNPNRR